MAFSVVPQLPRTRRKRARSNNHVDGSWSSSIVSSAGCVIVLTGIYLLFLYQTERVLTSVETGQNFRFHSLLFQQPHGASSSAPVNAMRNRALVRRNDTSAGDRFIMFSGNLGGQGIGNLVSGLLAAHLLALEFDRIVCVLPDFKSFLEVFEPIDPAASATNCPSRDAVTNYISLVNFEKAPNECELKEVLAGPDKVILMIGNTYPRWPAVPDGFFLQYYRPKQVLLDALSYDSLHPPTTVVHLRWPDGAGDASRKGLDEASLKALGNALPKGKDTFLVTNKVAFYQRFTDCCQWSHPKWNSVKHSASGIQWGSLNSASSSTSTVSQNVQMFADWYTILMAKEVYHTHSDFSISARHWMNNAKTSHSIVGAKQWTGALETHPEPWVVDGESAPLSQRTRHAAQDINALRLCDQEHRTFRQGDVRRRRDRHDEAASKRHDANGSSASALSRTKTRIDAKAQSIESLLSSHKEAVDEIAQQRRVDNSMKSAPAKQNVPKKFLLFDGELAGQGTGNVISGLLAAHLLGQEFNRIVCVLPSYQSFLDVFEPIGHEAVTECPRIRQHTTLQDAFNTISLVNYANAPNECTLKEKLANDDIIWYINANTYPRWPAVPKGYFFQHYRPRQNLLVALPYPPDSPPTTVVHLRAPDDAYDTRRGLDDESLVALGETVPKGKDTYLVTNKVAFYQRFADCCQWSHPKWVNVRHSAIGIDWGTLPNASSTTDTVDQTMQMWVDWYTILIAQNVYHTHSDFSISAIHWMDNRNSYSIVGFNNGTLETKEESWRVDGETAPLVQRTLEANGTARLRLCNTEDRFYRPKPKQTEEQRKEVDKFLLFDAFEAGQGIGNIVAGLLSAHLLGQEFNRTVCVLPHFRDFLELFEAIGEKAVALCPGIVEAYPTKGTVPMEMLENEIELVNFYDPPDECKIKKKLEGNDRLLMITGNTYPRWPKVPDRFFYQHYRAKQALLDVLPYDPQHPPSTLVHLRSPDDSVDIRRGLDDATLTALGNTLPKGKDTFLVTNRVSYYQRFADCCQ